MRRILEGEGLTTEEVPHGLAAAELLESGARFELLLVDWNMPELDGVGLVKRLNESGCAGGAKVVMVTSETAQARIVEALSAGADEYLMKPFDRDTLLSKLEILGLAPGAEDS